MSTVLDETIRAFADAVRETLAAAATGAPEEAVCADPVPEAEPDWTPQGGSAWRHRDGLAMVCRDNGRPGLPWLGALRRSAAGLVDPSFLTDTYGHIRAFPSEQEAMAACEAELERVVGTGTETEAAVAG